MALRRISASASASVASGKMVIGSTTMPLSNRFTLRTSSAWSSGDRLRWITPMPPACAIATARRASVTVSIAEEMIGTLRRIERVSLPPTSAWLGMIVLCPGRSRTSSKARPSGKADFSTIEAIANSLKPRAPPVRSRGSAKGRALAAWRRLLTRAPPREQGVAAFDQRIVSKSAAAGRGNRRLGVAGAAARRHKKPRHSPEP